MKRFHINEVELKFLIEMINYLNDDEGNLMTEQGTNQCKEIFDRISNRPVMDLIIDTKAIDASLKQQQEELNND